MNILEEMRYVDLLAPRLDRFKKINRYSWNFRCPYCGDSKKRKSKARGYIFRHKDMLLYKCFNCDVANSFSNFLKFVDPSLYEGLRFDIYRSTHVAVEQQDEDLSMFKQAAKKEERPDVLSLVGLEKISELPHDHAVRRYLLARKIPEKKIDSLYFSLDYHSWANSREPSPKPEQRVIIPFLDENGAPILVQGRYFLGGGMDVAKYLTKRFKDDDFGFYGLDQIDWDEPVYLTEGPFDSMFLPNALAVGGAGLAQGAERLKERAKKIVLIFDNEPRNPQICLGIYRAIEAGHWVMVWPEDFRHKDINDMVLEGEDVSALLTAGVARDLNAMFKFSQWLRIPISKFPKKERDGIVRSGLQLRD